MIDMRRLPALLEEAGIATEEEAAKLAKLLEAEIVAEWETPPQ